MRPVSSIASAALLFCLCGAASEKSFDVNPGLRQPVKLPAFLKGKTFFVGESTGGAGSSSVNTVTPRHGPNPWGGITFSREFKTLDIAWPREPVEIVRQALVESLQAGGAIAQDEATADYSVSLKLHRFGLGEATWREYYAKLEMWVSVTDCKTGTITDVFALGTAAKRKEDNEDKAREAIQSSLETALARAVTNFLYNAKLASAVAAPPTVDEGATEGPATIEVRRFRNREGLTLPPEFPDFLYTQIIEKLKAAQLAEMIVGENEVGVSPTAQKLVLEGTMLKVSGASLWRGAGEKKLTAEITLRGSPNETILEKELTAGPNPLTRASWPDENELWSVPAFADRVVKEIRDARRK